MNAMLLESSVEMPVPLASCTNCPAVLRLERALEQLHRDFHREVGYWKSQHAKAVNRIEQLEEELEQSRGQVHALQDKLFGRKSEKSSQGNRSNKLFDPEDVAAAAKKRGAQRGHAGHGRRDYSHLPVTEEFVSLPDESLCCPICGKPAAVMSDTEDSEVLEIDVRAHRRRIRRRRYRATCDCDPAQRTLTAPPPPKLIPKGNYGVSLWTLVLLDKYSSYRPTERLLGQLEQYDLDLPAGTINDGLERIEPMLRPVYEAFCQRNRQGDFHQADETRWLVFAVLEGKKGYGWWLWVVLGADTVVYLLAPSRGHEVPQCIRHLYHINRERLQHPLDSAKFQEQDVLLRQAVEAMRVQAVEELSDPKLRQPCRKVLESLQEHWSGLTRFAEDSRIPMDNNGSERAARGPAVARKNFYGSGSLWSGWLAAMMFSLLATLAYWKINPRLWLAWYLESCAAAGGKAPKDIQPFLPWNLSDERRAKLGDRTELQPAPDTS